MFLRYYLDDKGNRVYTLKMRTDEGVYTHNAHPARFSPDDPNSKVRLQLKARYGLLPMQQTAQPL